MNRQQASENLKAIGIAEPTEQQITDYLNQLGAETKREKDRADKYKADADEVVSLRKQIEEKENAKLSDMELLQKEIESLKDENAKQIQANKDMQMRADLAKQGIVDEDAEKLIESVKSGSFDAETIGKIIADREAKAVSAKEQELLKGTKSPDGGTDGDNKSTAENLVKGMFGGQTQNNTVLSNYL